MSLVSRTVKKFHATKSNFSIDHILNVAGGKPSLENFKVGAEESKFEWLSCTRYRPPKLPRQRKKEGIQRSKLGRNPRIPFSSSQVAFLEAKFLRSPYLSSSDVSQLASYLKLSETRVKIWFQNRRAREKREKESKSSRKDFAEKELPKMADDVGEAVKFPSTTPPTRFSLDFSTSLREPALEKKNDLERAESLLSFHGSAHSKSLGSSGIFGESYSISDTSAGEQGGPSGKFQWKSKWQNNMFFVAYTTNWTTVPTYKVHDATYSTAVPKNIFQIIVTYLFFGCPVLFLQTFLGQFSRKGCLGIGAMLPLAHGYGFFMIVYTLLSASLNLYNCTVLLYYALLAIFNHPTPAWMLCLDSFLDGFTGCFGLEEMHTCIPCYDPKAKEVGPCLKLESMNFSALLFWHHTSREFLDDKSLYNYPDNTLAIHLGLTSALLFLVIYKGVRDMDGPIRIWNIFTVVSLTIMLSVVLFAYGRLHGILFLFGVTWESILDIHCWADSLMTTIVYLRLAEAGNMLFGSFTPTTVNTATRCVYLCATHFSIIVLSNIFVFLLTENFMCAINADYSMLLNYSATDHLFGLYPQALGILAAAPFWGSLYFLLVFGITLQTLLLQIIIIESTLSQEIIRASYFIYTRFLILMILGLTNVGLITPRGTALIPMFNDLLTTLRLFAVFLFLVVVLLYGFQRLFDDIHFLLRHPPSNYYRISWCISVILMGSTLSIYLIFATFRDEQEVYWFTLFILFSTLLLGFSYKFVVYLKEKDLSSLVRPEEKWGPEDQEMRANRRLFNPRHEVKFRRRVETCNHRCLLSSVALKRTLEKELALVSNVLLEIEDNEAERKLKEDVVQALRVHRSLMSKFLQERSTGEMAIILKRHVK